VAWKNGRQSAKNEEQNTLPSKERGTSARRNVDDVPKGGRGLGGEREGRGLGVLKDLTSSISLTKEPRNPHVVEKREAGQFSENFWFDKQKKVLK